MPTDFSFGLLLLLPEGLGHSTIPKHLLKQVSCETCPANLKIAVSSKLLVSDSKTSRLFHTSVETIFWCEGALKSLKSLPNYDPGLRSLKLDKTMTFSIHQRYMQLWKYSLYAYLVQWNSHQTVVAKISWKCGRSDRGTESF